MSDVFWLERIAPCIRRPKRGSGFHSYTWHMRHHPNWIEPMRVIYDYELVLFSEGHCVVEIEGQRFDCVKGRFIIIPPGHRHVSWEAAGRFAHRHWAHFDWVYQGPRGGVPIATFDPEPPRAELYRWAPDFVPRQIFFGTIRRFQQVMDLSERLSSLEHGGHPHELLVSRALLLELLVELLDEERPNDSGNTPEAQLEDQARLLLEANLEKHAKLRIEDLLEETGYSYAHVCRVFKRRYGMPPLKFLHLLCISRAKLMLRDTDLPVNVIAKRLGYADPEYFSQVFRRNTGHAPSDYRNIIRV